MPKATDRSRRRRGEHDLLVVARTLTRKPSETCRANPRIPLIGMPFQLSQVPIDSACGSVPPTRVKVAQEVSGDDVEIDGIPGVAVDSRLGSPYTDLESGSELDEGSDLVLQPAGPEAGQT